MTDFDPGRPDGPVMYRKTRKSNKPAARRGDTGTTAGTADNTGHTAAEKQYMDYPAQAAPASFYSRPSSAGEYRTGMYERPSAAEAPSQRVYGENDLPTLEQTRLAAAGGSSYDLAASAGSRRRGTFSDGQKWVLILAAMVAVIALICVIGSLVRVAQANAAMRQVNEQHQKEARAYAEVVSNHLTRRASSGYEPLILKYAAMYGLNPDLVSAVIKRESDYQPRATSSVGARGLMQIMPRNVEWFSQKAGLSGCTVDDLYDPETNIHLGCWYLHYLGEMFNYDPVLMVCAYHAGQGSVASWLKNYSSDGKKLTIEEIPMNDTRTYAQRVVNSYAIYAQH